MLAGTVSVNIATGHGTKYKAAMSSAGKCYRVIKYAPWQTCVVGILISICPQCCMSATAAVAVRQVRVPSSVELKTHPCWKVVGQHLEAGSD